MNLVNDILDISKIEAGKLELEQRVFHLPDVLRAAAEIVQVNAVHKNLSIELEISPELPEWVVGDQQRLRQVRHRMSVGGWWGVAEAGAAPTHCCRWVVGG